MCSCTSCYSRPVGHAIPAKRYNIVIRVDKLQYHLKLQCRNLTDLPRIICVIRVISYPAQVSITLATWKGRSLQNAMNKCRTNRLTNSLYETFFLIKIRKLVHKKYMPWVINDPTQSLEGQYSLYLFVQLLIRYILLRPIVDSLNP